MINFVKMRTLVKILRVLCSNAFRREENPRGWTMTICYYHWLHKVFQFQIEALSASHFFIYLRTSGVPV